MAIEITKHCDSQGSDPAWIGDCKPKKEPCVCHFKQNPIQYKQIDEFAVNLALHFTQPCHRLVLLKCQFQLISERFFDFDCSFDFNAW